MTSRSRIIRYLGHPIQRTTEPAFWAIQFGLAGVTLLHVLVEATSAFGEIEGSESLIHVPATLYLIPIAYAGFRYGIEGGLLTAVAAVALSLPNIALWHRRGFEWLGESVFLLVVGGVGLVVSLLVEREHRERSRAEGNSRRLRLLTAVSLMLSRAPGLERVLDTTLSVAKEAMGLKTAAVLPPDTSPPRPGEIDVPIETELRGMGVLRVVFEDPPSEEEMGLLRVLAGQMATAFENEILRLSEHERLRTYARLMIEAQEEERKRIARDLHDDIAQPLIVLGRNLEGLAKVLIDPSDPLLDALVAEARGVLLDVRRYGRELRPQLLDDLGLVPALEWLVSDISQRTGIKGEASARGPLTDLPSPVALTLFRVAQEAVKNIEKHSRSRWMGIEIEYEDLALEMVVADAGIGFINSGGETGSRERWGLLGMEERMKLLGGKLSVFSKPGAGTRVVAELSMSDYTQPSSPTPDQTHTLSAVGLDTQ